MSNIRGLDVLEDEALSVDGSEEQPTIRKKESIRQNPKDTGLRVLNSDGAIWWNFMICIINLN